MNITILRHYSVPRCIDSSLTLQVIAAGNEFYIVTTIVYTDGSTYHVSSESWSDEIMALGVCADKVLIARMDNKPH